VKPVAVGVTVGVRVCVGVQMIVAVWVGVGVHCSGGGGRCDGRVRVGVGVRDRPRSAWKWGAPCAGPGLDCVDQVESADAGSDWPRLERPLADEEVDRVAVKGAVLGAVSLSSPFTGRSVIPNHWAFGGGGVKE